MTYVAIQFRRLLCLLFGHRFEHEQHDEVLMDVCIRCRKLRGMQQLRYTMRSKVTRGYIKSRMVAHPPNGYSFISCNWKKRTARFVSPTGTLTL
jgi:Prophage protein (DUF1660)